MVKATKLRGLYVITPVVGSQTDPNYSHQLVARVELAIQGGAKIVQYRDKSNDRPRREVEARVLVELCNQYQVILIINDDVNLAATCGAHGVHLGGDDMPLHHARQTLGADAIIGASCYNRLELALAAQANGVDYVAFGRFFPSRTKPEAVQANLLLLHQAKQRLHVPIVAIGGITAQNGAQLIHAGADMLAVVDAVFAQADIRAAAQELTQCFE